MADRLYKPGTKQPRRFNPGSGRISKNRFAWLRTALGQFVVMRYLPPEEDEEGEEGEPDPNRPKDREVGPSYVLQISHPQSKRPLSINFTALTLAEFEKTRQLFNLLFDLAEPVIRERDQVARDAFAEGDDSFNRLYREVPRLIIREGAGRQNIEGVQYGPSGVPLGTEAGRDSSGDVLDSDGGVRGDGDELANSESPEGRSQDNREKTD